MKTIFLGTPEFASIILDKLASSQYRPILVVTAPDKPVGRKQIVTPPPTKVLAQKYDIEVLQPEKLKEIIEQIKTINPDVILTAAYGKLIPQSVLDIPKYGTLNVHPSLLPKYRGPSPIHWAILNGEKETGVTIMLVDKEMDHGNIVASSKYLVTNNDTYMTVHNELAEMGANLLLETVPKWISGEIKAQEQDHFKATYSKIIKSSDGLIDWKKPPNQILDQIKAFDFWPQCYIIYNDKRLKILKANIENNELVIKEVQLEGKNPMPFNDFLKGHSSFDISKLK